MFISSSLQEGRNKHALISAALAVSIQIIARDGESFVGVQAFNRSRNSSVFKELNGKLVLVPAKLIGNFERPWMHFY